MNKVDKKWFQDKIHERGTSQRQVAFKLGMDPAAFSLILSGRRKLEVREAAAIALLIGQPLNEVMVRAGVPLRSQTVSVVGHVTGDLDVEWGRNGRVPSHGLGAEYEALTSDYYGWTFYIGPECETDGMVLAQGKIHFPGKTRFGRPVVLIRT